MGGSGPEQGAFAWLVSELSARDGSSAGQGRPGAPPAAGGGGARGAPRGKAKPGERLRSMPSSAAKPLPPDNELWDVHVAARFLGRSVSWVYHKAEDGTLPVKRLGGWGLRFVPGELRAWVERGAPPRRG
jgi:predicted DNA-binding transcriptional regulator AlpA